LFYIYVYLQPYKTVAYRNSKENPRVKKGDQLGYFQFGGFTHCLVFKKDAIAQFASNPNRREISIPIQMQ